MFRAVGLIAAAIVCAASSAFAQSLPTWGAPIPATATSVPYSGAASPVGVTSAPDGEVLKAHRYVEQEYFINGTVDGKPYRTSVLVRKPGSAAKFSGLVFVESVHAQGPLGVWGTNRDVLLDGGHAYVAVGSQRASIEGPIKSFNKARYAALTLPEGPSAAAVQSVMTVDTVSNAILTQVGALLKSNTKDGPFKGMPVKYLALGGASQTGVATQNFLKHAHAAAHLANGKPIYDGYFPSASSSLEPINPQDAKVMLVSSEGDFAPISSIGPSGYLGARPDSDAPGDRYRTYQIAGSSHLPTRGVTANAVPALNVTLKPGEKFTQFPSYAFHKAALYNFLNWVAKDVPPPGAPRIEIANGAIARDQYGNAKGGIRSPYVDVPTSRYEVGAYIRLVGVEHPFSAEQLRALYPSRADYLRKFDQGIDKLVAERMLLPGDAATLKREQAANPPF